MYVTISMDSFLMVFYLKGHLLTVNHVDPFMNIQ